MTFSLCWSYINARHFKSKIDIFGNFVPGMIFFQSIFGYLVFCIIYKWSVDWPARGQDPPGLLNLLIYMFLSPGTITERLYGGQEVIQVLLLLLAVVQVPILLFLKPFYLRWEHNRARTMGYRGIGENTRVSALDDDDDDEGHGHMNGGRPSFAQSEDGDALITQDIGGGEGEGHEFEFSEIMIHQVIHTIGKLSCKVVLRWLGLTPVRILLEHRLPHRLIPSSLGPVSCTSTAVNRPLVNDPRQRFLLHWCRRRLRHLCLLRRLVCTHDCRACRHGRNVGYASLLASALGGGDE